MTAETPAEKYARAGQIVADAVKEVSQSIVDAEEHGPAAVLTATALGVPRLVAARVEAYTLIANAVAGIADAGLSPEALGAAKSDRTLVIRQPETLIDPKGCAELSEMLRIQRERMEET